ncbi:MAG: sulfite exporter TauE/SafE family protein [Puniceicoccaceae bacterium]|nr:MAG: sulfite exporter TauE/SafE family protein [Puniceicoccaceae bacterium]
MSFEPWEWGLLAIAAVLVGMAKTGIAGLGILFVAVFANLMPAKQASGFVLPLLIVGDVVAVLVYRRHTKWHHLWRLFPWTAAGVVLGYLAMGRMDDRQASVLIGGILLGMVALHLWRVRRRAAVVEEKAVARAGPVLAASTGLLAGFTTLVANAAGPVMILYLLAMRLPKLEFVGTGAVFFLLLNLFKVPFMADLGLIHGESLRWNLWLAPAVLAGAWLGWRLLKVINQKLFERLALGLTVVAALRMVWG